MSIQPSLGRFSGKVAIVTGSTRGIGLEIARRILTEGGAVVVTGRSAEAGRKALASLGDAARTRFLLADLTSPEAAAALVADCLGHFGRLDVLINNAAPTDLITAGDATIEAIDPDIWARVLDGAATVTLRMTQAAIPALRATGAGAIVNISTSVASRGVHGMAAHSASKAAVESITRSAAVELGRDGIRSNALVLGFIVSGPRQADVAATERGIAIRGSQLLDTFGQPDDVAAAAAFLASDDARFITGAFLHLDGGTACRMPLPVLPGTRGRASQD